MARADGKCEMTEALAGGIGFAGQLGNAESHVTDEAVKGEWGLDDYFT
jgi:hypothetical protein